MPILPNEFLLILSWNIRVLPIVKNQSFLEVDAEIVPDGIQGGNLILEYPFISLFLDCP